MSARPGFGLDCAAWPGHSCGVKITDVTVKRYRASREPGADAGGIQIVEVDTDAGVSGMGFVSAGGATSDIVATLIRRNLKAVVAGEDPLLTDDLWRRMHAAGAVEASPGRSSGGGRRRQDRSAVWERSDRRFESAPPGGSAGPPAHRVAPCRPRRDSHGPVGRQGATR